MSVEWALSIVVRIFKGKGGIRNCSCYRVVKLFELHNSIATAVQMKVIGKT